MRNVKYANTTDNNRTIKFLPLPCRLSTCAFHLTAGGLGLTQFFSLHRVESKPFFLVFITSSVKPTPPSQVCYFSWLIFILSVLMFFFLQSHMSNILCFSLLCLLLGFMESLSLNHYVFSQTKENNTPLYIFTASSIFRFPKKKLKI